MAPKTAKKKAAAKVEKVMKPAAKSEPKADKKSLKAAAAAPVAPDAPAVDLDELEEQQDAAAASSSAGGNAAALAAASSTTEMSASFKNFRHHPDMENFYRFIFDNDLRHEALAIIDEMMLEKLNRKLIKATKAQAH